MTDIISIILVAILGVVGNIFYFEYRLKKEHGKELISEQLTKLLMPLYIILKMDELAIIAFTKDENISNADYLSEMPDRLLKPIREILVKNLYLADNELQVASLSFIKWAYKQENNERYESLMTGNGLQDETLEEFRSIVYRKYDKQKTRYLK